MKNKLLSTILSVSIITGLLTGCQSAPTETPITDATNDLSGTLVLAIWDNDSMHLYEEMDLEGRFQKLYPHAAIEVEKIKDDSEYWNTMKIRAAANQLPDIMCNKPFTLSRFQDYLLDLSDTSAATNNMLAEGYAINGKVLGIPERKTQEYVFYWKNLFKEAGVCVPTTWGELEEVSLRLQDFYGKDNKNFAAIAIGGKDESPTYPFMEYMPCLEQGNGQYWNDMATQDAPFAADTDITKAYQKVYTLFQSGVFGKDPNGIGHDQAVALFAQQQSAMIACGGWGLTSITEGADNIDELGTFYLPTRDSVSDPFRTITQGDSFLSITSSSDNPELAKAFLEFYFSDAWYPEYIAALTDDNTMKNVTKDKAPTLAQADELQPNAELIMYAGSGDDFTALQSETTFDYKKLGAQMLVKDFDLNAALKDLNTKWAAARAKLGIE
ncbi:MAG: extracellular solute-binding protein [Lachnospiraceae bacterium]